MAKLRSNYENSWWERLKRWIGMGSDRLERAMIGDLEQESSAHRAPGMEDVMDRERAIDLQHQRDVDAEREMYDKIHAWTQTRGAKIVNRTYVIASIALCLGIIYVLLITVANLPTFGSVDNPLNNEVSERYIEDGLSETGAVNIVTGMILDYRAFDTLGESNVLFIAACSVLILLRINSNNEQEKLESEANDRNYEPSHDIILQKIAGILVPLILLFGVYVLLNGHLSPGGGFSGGAVMGAGLILYLSAFGFQKTERFFTFKTFRVISFIALSFYALSKCYSFFMGANHLESGITTGTPGAILSSGLILPLNVAVGLVVACTMYAFYTLFRKGDM